MKKDKVTSGQVVGCHYLTEFIGKYVQLTVRNNFTLETVCSTVRPILSFQGPTN